MKLKNSNTCVYLHINPMKHEIFYVGIGDIDRPYEGKNKRSKWWYNTANKYGYAVVIIHENLTWKEACEFEIKYIAQIGRADLGKGTLVNLTDGGDGNLGYKHTNEAKAKMSLSQIGNKKRLGISHSVSDNVMKNLIGNKYRQGISHTMSDGAKDKLRTANVGKICTNETKLKMSLAKIGKSKTGLIGKGKPWTEARRLAQANKKNEK